MSLFVLTMNHRKGAIKYEKINKIVITVLMTFSLAGCAQSNIGLEVKKEKDMIFTVDFLYNEKTTLNKIEQGAHEYTKELLINIMKKKMVKRSLKNH